MNFLSCKIYVSTKEKMNAADELQKTWKEKMFFFKVLAQNFCGMA